SAAEAYGQDIKTALDTLRNARADAIGARADFYGNAPEKQAAANAHEQQWLTDSLAPWEQNLHQDQMNATIALVQGVAGADLSYAQTMADANRAYDRGLAKAQYEHDGDVKGDERTQTSSLNDVDSANREGTSSARQAYEVGLYQDHRDAMNSLASAA